MDTSYENGEILCCIVNLLRNFYPGITKNSKNWALFRNFFRNAAQNLIRKAIYGIELVPQFKKCLFKWSNKLIFMIFENSLKYL